MAPGAAGKIFGLLGSNGAGKSTLVKMMTTLLPPTEGDALVVGASIVEDPSVVRSRIGYVPQMLSADGMLTGRENLTCANSVSRPLPSRTSSCASCCAIRPNSPRAPFNRFSGLFSTFSLIIACIVKTRERFMGIGQVLTMPFSLPAARSIRSI